MKRLTTISALFIIILLAGADARAQTSNAQRVSDIQAALREAKLDGWLFYDFRRSDPLAYRILRLDDKSLTTRRWFYFVPVVGEPVNEYDIQQFMVRRYEEEGLTSDNDPPNVSVGPNSANPHYQPDAKTHSPIRRGDFVLFDVWAKLKKPGAVYADQTWTGYVGEAVPAEYTRVFRIVREARDAATDFVRSSVRDGKVIRGAQVDDVSRAVIERAGFGEQFTHRTGHSIGEEVHGNGAHIDNLETRDSRRITPRTSFSIEPGIYLEGKFGVRSEINVYVGERDIEVTGGPVQTEVVAILGGQ